MGLTGTVAPHSLRKAFCDYVYTATRDPVLTARITGHTNPAQLLRYIGRLADVEAGVWDRMAADLK
jgi:integrase